MARHVAIRRLLNDLKEVSAGGWMVGRHPAAVMHARNATMPIAAPVALAPRPALLRPALLRSASCSRAPLHPQPCGPPVDAAAHLRLPSRPAPPQVLEHPQPDAAALPTEDDLMVWHANLRTQEGPLAGLALHALLLFSDDYPARGPAIRLFHALPHPNIALHLSPSQ